MRPHPTNPDRARLDGLWAVATNWFSVGWLLPGVEPQESAYIIGSHARLLMTKNVLVPVEGVDGSISVRPSGLDSFAQKGFVPQGFGRFPENIFVAIRTDDQINGAVFEGVDPDTAMHDALAHVTDRFLAEFSGSLEVMEYVEHTNEHYPALTDLDASYERLVSMLDEARAV